MRLPRTVDIGGQKVKVIFKKDLSDKGIYLLGLCDYDGNRIVLQKGMPDSKKLAVFCHEYWHFVSNVYGMNLTESKVNNLEVATLRLMQGLKLI